MLGRTHGLWWSAAARYLNTAPVWRCGASWLPWQLTHLPQGVDIIKLPNACHSLGVLGELVALAGIDMGANTHTHTVACCTEFHAICLRERLRAVVFKGLQDPNMDGIYSAMAVGDLAAPDNVDEGEKTTKCGRHGA